MENIIKDGKHHKIKKSRTSKHHDIQKCLILGDVIGATHTEAKSL